MNPAIHSQPLARAALLAIAAPLFLACSSPERQDRGMDAAEAPASSSGMVGGRMPMMGNGMISGGMMGASMEEMRVIRGLLANPGRIERSVENIPNGVRTVTRSADLRVTALIRTHVRQMRAHYDRDQPIRMTDPVFRELFANRDRLTLAYQDVPGGIRVSHTSSDPDVVLLIRQHAHRFVSEAAEEGMRRAMRPTPLPEGYNGRPSKSGDISPGP